jgi:hypothetical protein
MYHFSNPHLNKRPEPKGLIWLIPIRYWELENEPEKFEVCSVSKNEDGTVSAYGYHSGYGHEVYINYEQWPYDICADRPAL